MCIQIVRGHSDQELAAAEWSAVESLELCIAGLSLAPETRQALQQTLHNARAGAATSQQWAEALAQSLATVYAQAERAPAALRDLEITRMQLESYRRIVEENARNPLRQQVQQLTQERDQLRDQEALYTQRIERLTKALARAKHSHQAETERMKADIGRLNRIVVEQQERLNANQQ